MASDFKSRHPKLFSSLEWKGKDRQSLALNLFQAPGSAGSEALVNTFRISLALKQQTSMCCSLLNRERQEQTEDWRLALKLGISEAKLLPGTELRGRALKTAPSF